ncbi:hypothetical protein O3M35_001988 [Rhynocoris fuscipes]|uniref:Cytochrome c oxidase assembly factor 7 n=1 Tax=Rhynocoris fuscipes TaxID=488301 RepID=A0AAW1CQV5_9HEMI
MDECHKPGTGHQEQHHKEPLESLAKILIISLFQGVERLRKGCDGKHADACHHLSALYMEDSHDKQVVSKDMKKAFEYAVKACDLGNIYACVNVSIMYMRGDGVEKDQKQSDKYKNIAIEKKKEAEKAKQLVFQEGLKPA